MADKTGQSIYAPIDTDMQSATVIIEDGIVTSIESGCTIRQDDPNAQYRCDPGSLRSVPAEYSQAIQDAFAALPAALAANVAGKEFP